MLSRLLRSNSGLLRFHCLHNLKGSMTDEAHGRDDAAQSQRRARHARPDLAPPTPSRALMPVPRSQLVPPPVQHGPGSVGVWLMRSLLAALFLLTFGAVVYFIVRTGQPPEVSAAVPVQPPTATALLELIPALEAATAQPVDAARTLNDAASIAALPGPGDRTRYGYVSAHYNPSDGKPVYVCAMTSFISNLTLAQIQTERLDEKYGFHLALVPYDIDAERAAITQEEVEDNMNSGRWDCELSTLDAAARGEYGAITAVIDESVGGDGLYARGVASIYDLRGRALAYERDSSSEYFLRHVLFISGLDPARDVVMLPFSSIEDAIQAFADGKADVVSAYDPYFETPAATGGAPLIMSDQLRIVVDVVLTSKHAIKNKPDLVQAFHNAWFEAVKRQFENPDSAAASIAAWGHNTWTQIPAENPQRAFDSLYRRVAMASLQQNAALLSNPDPLFVAMQAVRATEQLPPASPQAQQALIDARFVNTAAQTPDLLTSALPLNATFSLAGNQDAAMQTVLPCRRYGFLPNTVTLTEHSKRILDICVLPALRQRPAAQLSIVGSAAWPGPPGAFSAEQIQAFGLQRAQAVADYLIANGIAAERLRLNSVLPPEARRNTSDLSLQAEDRFVEMTLSLGGW